MDEKKIPTQVVLPQMSASATDRIRTAMAMLGMRPLTPEEAERHPEEFVVDGTNPWGEPNRFIAFPKKE